MKKQDNKQSKEIEKLRVKIQELETGWKRTQADFDNYRKRTEQMKSEWNCQANLELILKLLPVLDNFQLAAQHTPDNLKENEWIKGVEMIEKHLEDILTQEGLSKIDVKPGGQFDPYLHEAISHEENKNFKSDQIIDVIETGYKLADKIIRPAKVRVAK